MSSTIQGLLARKYRIFVLAALIFTSIILLWGNPLVWRKGASPALKQQEQQQEHTVPLRVSPKHGNTDAAFFAGKFPRRLWQTGKHGFPSLDDLGRELLGTWMNLNPAWRYEALTRDTEETYVIGRFGDEPEMRDVFLNIKDPILRADMVRYLVLLKEGGVYSDSDTKCLKPIEKWIPDEFKEAANMVIGVEYDVLDGVRWSDWTLDLQFTTWALLTIPNHPLMRKTVENLMQGLNRLAKEQKTTIGGITTTFSQVLDYTGPAMFTNMVFEYLSESHPGFNWKNITGLQQPLLVNDILILPVTSLSCCQSHSNAKDEDDPSAFVKHMFAGSWKTAHNLQDELKQKAEAAKVEEEKKKQEEERKKKEAEEAKKFKEAEEAKRLKQAEAKAKAKSDSPAVS